MESTDPLLLLREALTSSEKVVLKAADGTEVESLAQCAEISLPPYNSSSTFAKTSPTRYLQTTSGNVAEAPRYQLQAVLFAYQSANENVGQYIRLAREQDVTTFVSIQDRRAIVDWLTGKVSLDSLGAKLAPLGDARDTANGASASSMKRDGEPSSTSLGDAKADGSGHPPPAKKQRFVPNRDDQEKVKRMMAIIEGPAWGIDVSAADVSKGDAGKQAKKGAGVMKNRETVLEGQRLNNFESVRSLVMPRLELSRAEERDKKSAAAGSTATPQSAIGKSKRKLNDPIIIVSPSSTALINMYNVKQFLERSTFEPPEVARASGDDAPGELVHIRHQRTTTSSSHSGQGAPREARYFVVDSVEALERFKKHSPGEDPWDRVVCVMTTGQEWQFRGYKWAEPKDLFHHVKGIFVQWTTDQPNAKVRSWNVSEMRIDPSKRHIDKSTVANFWRDLESWIAMHKPHLSY